MAYQSKQLTSKENMGMTTPQLPDYSLRMQNHMARLGSYSQWTYTSSASFPSRLSRAGFFHIGPRDRVKCVECGVELENWMDPINVNGRHHLASPSCQFIQRIIDEHDDPGLGNSISSHGSTASASIGAASLEKNYGAASPYVEPRMPSISEASNPSENSRSENVIQLREQPASERRCKKTPEMFKSLENRLKSYEGIPWPKYLRVQPDSLSNAGLYYVGPEDRVKCVYCGGVLKKWQPNDSAIEEHLRHYPECEFLQSSEEKSKVLAQNIKSKKDVKNCISSDVLQKAVAKERKRKQQKSNINALTLKRLGYTWSQINMANSQAQEQQLAINVINILPIIQRIEKDAFLSGNYEAAMDDNRSEDEMTSLECDQKEQLLHVDREHRFSHLQESERLLRKEVEDMKARMTCKICLTNPIDTLFLTCRHFVSCKDCGDRVKDCPICRQIILGTVDVFIP